MEIVDVQTVSLSKNGSFSYFTNAGGSPAWTPGKYTITAEDSDGSTGSVTITYDAESTVASSATTPTTSVTAPSSSATSTASVIASTASTSPATASSASGSSSALPLMATGAASVLVLVAGALALAGRKRGEAGSGPTIAA
jgi:uncharacterized membrane protein